MQFAAQELPGAELPLVPRDAPFRQMQVLLRRTDAEIYAWSVFQDRRGPSDLESRQLFNKI